MQQVKRFFIYNIIVAIAALQIVALVNYWFFIYHNIANANINTTIAYQGKVVDATSVVIADGSYNMAFRIYDNVSGGNLLWEEKWDGSDQDEIAGGTQGSQVSIIDGMFTVDLNSLCSNWTTSACAKTLGGVDFNTASLYLEVRLDADSSALTGVEGFEEVFAPRKRFSSIAYAMNADKLDGYDVGTSGDALPLLSADNEWSGVQTIEISNTANKGIVIQGAVSQSANLIEFQINDSTAISSINSEGYLQTSNIFTNKVTTNASGVGAAPATSSSGVVGYWKLDDGTGSLAADSGAFNLTGTLVGTTTWPVGNFGYSGDYSVDLNGTSQYIQVSDTPLLSPGNSVADSAFSIEGWVYLDTLTQGGIFSKYNETTALPQREWLLYAIGDGRMQAILFDESTDGYLIREAPASTISSGGWKHVVMTYDGSGSVTGLKIFLNGVQVDTTSNVNGSYVAMEDTSQNVMFGSYVDASAVDQEIDGKIDNVIYWNTQLTSSDILSHYQTGLNSGYGLQIDTSVAYSGNELLAIKNAGSTVASFNSAGALTTTGVTSTGQILASPDSNIVPLVIKAHSTQTANLTEWRNNSDTVIASIDMNGNLETPSLLTNELITPLITSNSTPTGSAPSVGVSGQVAYWKMDDNAIYGESSTDDGLVGWWKLNDGTGTSVADSSTNSNNGTLISGTWAGNSPFTGGNAVSLDGAGDYVSVASSPSLNFERTDVFTIQSWIKTSTGNAFQTIVGKQNDSTGNYKGYHFYLDNSVSGVLMFVFASTASPSNYIHVKGSTGLSDGNWHHVSVTYDGSSSASGVRLYVDGVEESATILTNTLSSTTQNTSNLRIGSRQQGDTDFLGSISNTSIYSNVKSAADIQRAYRKGLSTHTVDSVGGNHGLISGATWTGSGSIGYAGDDSLTFNGSSSVSVNNHASLNPSSISVVAWVKTSDTGVFRGVVDKGWNNGGYVMDINSGYPRFGVQSAGGTFYTATGSTNVTDNEWHLLVGTFSGGEVKIYVDGVLEQTTSSASMATTTLGLSIGGDNASSYYLNGQIDGVIIYDNALTLTDVTNMYANATGGGTGLVFDTESTFATESSKLVSFTNAGTEKLYVGLNILGFSGDADKTIQVDRVTTASTAGYDLTVSAGGAVSGGTNLSGGNLYLVSGLSTGTGSSSIYLQTSGAGSSGASDNALVTRLVIAGDGSVQVADDTELRFYDGSNYVGFKAPTLSANKIWTLPSDDGSAGQVLQTDGSGILSWTNRLDMNRTAVSSTPYNATSSDVYLGVTYTTTSSVTINLPAPSAEKVIIIKDEGGSASTNNITINRNSTEVIDGNNSITISTDYGSVRLYSNGINWFSY